MADSHGSQASWVDWLGRAGVSSNASIVRKHHWLGRACLGYPGSMRAPPLAGARTSIDRACGRRLVGLGLSP
jgi:hypothetical protein